MRSNGDDHVMNDVMGDEFGGMSVVMGDVGNYGNVVGNPGDNRGDLHWLEEKEKSATIGEGMKGLTGKVEGRNYANIEIK